MHDGRPDRTGDAGHSDWSVPRRQGVSWVAADHPTQEDVMDTTDRARGPARGNVPAGRAGDGTPATLLERMGGPMGFGYSAAAVVVSRWAGR